MPSTQIRHFVQKWSLQYLYTYFCYDSDAIPIFLPCFYYHNSKFKHIELLGVLVFKVCPFDITNQQYSSCIDVYNEVYQKEIKGSPVKSNL